MSAAAMMTVPNADAATVRRLIAEALEVSKNFPPDPRLERATTSLVSALADVIRFQANIGGAP